MKRTLNRIERQVARRDDSSSTEAGAAPVDPKTFVESRDYMNAKGELYPEVMKAHIELNSDRYAEAVITGGIGCGKTTLGLFAMLYQLYRLSCIAEPHERFGLSPSSEIVLIFQSFNAELAKNVDFERFREMIDRSPYFRERFRYRKATETELRFPRRIVVRAISGQPTAALGQNIFGGMLDEVNFMGVVSGSRRSIDGGAFDRALSNYNALNRRRKSRFMQRGQVAGIVCLVSSKQRPGDFTELKIEEAKKHRVRTGKTDIFVYDKRSWDIKPKAHFSGEWFKVFPGSRTRQAYIVDDGDHIPPADEPLLKKIPKEYYADFERDPVDALRDIAGVSIIAANPFLANVEAVAACFGRHESILSRPDTDFTATELRIYSTEFFKPDLQRFIHLDLSRTRDATGLVIACVSKFEEVDRGGGLTEQLPRFHVDAALQIHPAKGGEVRYDKIRALIHTLRRLGLNVRYVTADRYQSADMLQQLRRNGLVAGERSVDQDRRPYEVLKSALQDGRVDIPHHPVLQQELLGLVRRSDPPWVDHPPHGSKDVADALAGAVFGLYNCPKVWQQHDINPYPLDLKIHALPGPSAYRLINRYR